jgi:hypothetical protein
MTPSALPLAGGGNIRRIISLVFAFAPGGETRILHPFLPEVVTDSHDLRLQRISQP